MNELKRETVKKAYKEFYDRFGLPAHVETEAQLRRIIDLDHRELAKRYNEDSFPKALSIAWQQARKFPCVPDFHRGFDAPSIEKTDVII